MAGLSMAEMDGMEPGYVSDLFIYRMRYDDQLHGIQRKRASDDITI